MHQDVFGRAIADYYNGDSRAVIKVITELSGVHDIPVHYMFRSLDEMPTLELTALKECKGSVLDVGAGAGSHSLELQELGHDVVAIDNSPLAVKIMRKRGVVNAETLDFMQVEPPFFDTYLMMMNGLGLVETLDGLRHMFSSLEDHFAKGAQVICESTNLLEYKRDDFGVVEIDNSRDYYGEVVYDLAYRDLKKSGFKWLYIDINTLTSIVKDFDLCMELLFEGEWDNYLVRIYKG